MKNLYIVAGTIAILVGLGVITVQKEILLPNSEARTLLAQGRLLLEQENNDEMRRAVELFTMLASRFPKSPQAKEALYYLAESYEKLGNVDVAIYKYRGLLGLDLNEEMVDRVRFKIARLQMMRQNAEEGMNSMLMLLSKKVEPSLRSDIYTEMGRYYADTKNFEKAINNYEIAISEFPRNVDANVEIGDVYFKKGDYKKALEQYKKVYRVFIDRSAANEPSARKYINNVFEKGVQIFKQENYEQAAEYFEFIHENFAKTRAAEESLYYHGNILYAAREYEKAISMFRMVIELPPVDRDENAYIKSGQSFYQLGQFQKASMLFAKAQELFPSGRYLKIAREWEDESKKALAESYSYEPANETNTRPDDNLPVRQDRKETPKAEESGSKPEPSLDDGTVVP